MAKLPHIRYNPAACKYRAGQIRPQGLELLLSTKPLASALTLETRPNGRRV